MGSEQSDKLELQLVGLGTRWQKIYRDVDGNRVTDSKIKESIVVLTPVVESKQASLQRIDNQVTGLSRKGSRRRLFHEKGVKEWELVLHVDTGVLRPLQNRLLLLFVYVSVVKRSLHTRYRDGNIE